MDYIENRTFDEIKVGDSASLSQTLTLEDVKLFAVMSGDVNPAHVDEEYARSDMFHKIVAHGMWGGALISTVLGTKLPGPGAIYLGQTLKFMKPVGLGRHRDCHADGHREGSGKASGDARLSVHEPERRGGHLRQRPGRSPRPRRSSDPRRPTRSSPARPRAQTPQADRI